MVVVAPEAAVEVVLLIMVSGVVDGLNQHVPLPKSLRAREISWNRELLIGKYTATAHINRGYDDVIDTKTITFWVFPWKVVVPVFIGLFVIFFLIRFFAKNFEFKRKSG